MKFFVDTADVKEIRELNDIGLLDGVTTNPSLIMKAGRDITEVTKEICGIVDGPVSTWLRRASRSTASSTTAPSPPRSRRSISTA